MKRWMLFLYLSSSKVCEKAEEVKRHRLRLKPRKRRDMLVTRFNELKGVVELVVQN